MTTAPLLPRPLRPGDEVALLSPASWSDPGWIETSVTVIESWGLRARVGTHADDRYGYLAGTDRDRLADLDDALRDPAVRAIVCLRGGCGSFRLVPDVDVDALRADPIALVGFSDITALHGVWHEAGVVSLHGPVAGAHTDDVRRLLTGEALALISADPTALGAELTTSGIARGPLVGGNLEMLARSVGVTRLDLCDGVLLLEIHRAAGLGMVDRALTQLLLSGTLDGLRGVALGALEGFDGYVDRDWDVLDVLRDRLLPLGVPVLGGLPLGHVPDPRTVPLGVEVELDADGSTLTVAGSVTSAP